jgi:hypothetical protein
VTLDQYLLYVRLFDAEHPGHRIGPTLLAHVASTPDGGRARTELYWHRREGHAYSAGWRAGMWGAEDPVQTATGRGALELWEDRTGLAVTDPEILLL